MSSNTSKSGAHRHGGAYILAVTIALLTLLPASVNAEKVRISQGDFGSAEQPSFQEAISVAVDRSGGDLLVFDREAKTLSRFKPNGEPDPFPALGTNVIDAKNGPGGKACGEEPASCDRTPQDGFHGAKSRLAIDNSGTVTDGDIYVTDFDFAANHFEDFADVFAADGHFLGQLTAVGGSPLKDVCGAAVDSSGNLFLSTFDGSAGSIYKFDPSANPPLSSDNVSGFSASYATCDLAAGIGPTAGSLFSSRYPTGGTRKLDATSGTLQYLVDPEHEINNAGVGSVAVDPGSGHVLVGSTEWDASGPTPTKVSSVGGSPSSAKAFSNDGSKVYVANGSQVIVLGPVVTAPDVATGVATITGDTSATLSGVVNPDGVPLEECFFEYGLAALNYDETVPCSETPAQIGTTQKTVHAEISGLLPNAITYHYRLVAKNINAVIHGDDQSFSTPDKPKIGDQWATEVSTDEARLAATINPGNSPTTYRFEYGDQGPCDANPCATFPQPPAAELSAGSGNEDQILGAVVGGLKADTTYEWRVVATNNLGSAEAVGDPFHTFPIPGPDQTNCPNQQLRTGTPSAALPNCRAYEQVSPAIKGGTDIGGELSILNLSSFLTELRQANAWLRQASPDGSKLTYASARPFAEPEAAPYSSQYLSSRDPQSGWSTKGITPPTRAGQPARVLFDFQGFTPDLCSAFWLQASDIALDPGDQPGFPDLYRRDNCAKPATYQLLTTKPPSNQLAGAESEYRYHLHVQGFSSDAQRTVFRATGKLETNGVAASGAIEKGVVEGSDEAVPISQVYLNTGTATPRLVSVMPDGTAASSSSSAGGDAKGLSTAWMAEILATAVSEDASRVFFTTPMFKSDISTDTRTPRLYLRINADHSQSPVSGGHCSDPVRACTLAVSQSVDPGAAEFWVATPEGTKALFSFTSGAHSGELYSYDVATQTPTLIAPGLLGVYGASKDLSKVYLLSSASLAPGATAGQRNMYLYRAGQGFTLIATLSSAGDFFSTDFDNPHENPWAPYRRIARVSADGDHLAFFSFSPLTDYDSTDAYPKAKDSRPDGEVFVYDASASGGAGQLSCVSCNPSGARPVGRRRLGGAVPAAADIPGWETSFHATPVLAEDGSQLIFESYDALLPTDVNGKGDVYQWEAPGAGECQTTDWNYFAQNGGCLSLISGGQGTDDAELIATSIGSSDVFFTTRQRLFGGDSDALVDVYDARIDGGFAVDQQPPPCELGIGACEGPASSAPHLSGAGTAAFQGPGNPQPKQGCPKGQRKDKARCVKHKHRKGKAHHRQAKHNRGAGR